jgi:hypothetical protein
MNEVYGRYFSENKPARATGQAAEASEGRAGRDRLYRDRLIQSFKSEKAKRREPAFGRIKKVLPQLRSFDNFARFNAAGADLHPTVASRRKLNTDGLKIWVKASPRLVISV